MAEVMTSPQAAALEWLDLLLSGNAEEALAQCSEELRDVRDVVRIARTLVAGFDATWLVWDLTNPLGLDMEEVLLVASDPPGEEGKPVADGIVLRMRLGPDGWLVDDVIRQRT